MANLDTSEAVTGTGDRSRPRVALPALCITQITSRGIVYYAFLVLNSQITAVSASCVGGILDRRGPRAVMTTG